MDEGQLLFCSVRSLLLSAFIMTFIGAIGYDIYSRAYYTFGSLLILGLTSATCAFLGLGIPLVGLGGCAAVIGHRLNWILEKPLNPSAIAALAANFAFLVVMLIISAADPPLLTSALGIAFLFGGSLLFQATARIAITKQIRRHNALAGHKPYVEPPCQVQFRIRQLLLLTLVLAVGLALIQGLSAKAMLPLIGLSTVIMISIFYPAILVSTSFSRKFSKVRLKPWERGKADYISIDGNTRLAGDQTRGNSLSNTDAETNKLEALVIPPPQYQKTTDRFDECMAAVNWISCSGGGFAMGVLVIVAMSKAVHHGADLFSPDLVGVILVGIPGFVCIWVLSAMMNLVLWTLFVRLCKPGTLAAITGGAIGALGTFLMLCAIELVHCNYLGFINLDADNLFPLAMVLYGSLVGQVMGRMAIKVNRFRIGFSEEEYQALATDSLRAGSTWVKPLLLSVFCWCISLALNNGAADHSIQNLLLAVLTGVFGCMFAVWPLANILARCARVAPQAVPQPISAQLAPMPNSSRPKNLQI